MKNKIILTGAHGTGKTTLLNIMVEYLPNHKFISQVVRSTSNTKNLGTSKKSDLTSQYIYFGKYLELLGEDINLFSDRGLIDVAAYTKAIAFDKKDPKLLNLLLVQEEFIKKTKDNFIWFYTPIEFKIEEDGIRELDPHYQRKIDQFIKQYLNHFNINYITLTGNIEERINLIKSTLKL